MQRPVSPGQKGLGRQCGAGRERRTDVRLDLARRGPAAAVQHELFRGPGTQVLGQPLPATRRGDRTAGRVQPGGQPSAGDERRPHGRVLPVRGDSQDHRGRRALSDPGGDQGTLAPVQHRRIGRRHLSSGGRLHPACRPDSGTGKGRPRPGRRDLPQDRGGRNRPGDLRRLGSAYRQRRHHLRSRGLRDRELRPPDRRDGGTRHPRDAGGTPVHRHRTASRTRESQARGPARTRRAARIGRIVVPARGKQRFHPRSLRKGRALLLCGRPGPASRIRTVPGRHRSPHAAHRGRDEPGAGVRRSGDQESLQRRHRLHAGRQPDHRARVGHREFLAVRRAQLRHHGGGRRRLATGRVDRRGRADHRHAGRRASPLRRVRHERLPGQENRGSVRARLHHPLPGRGTARRASVAHRALLRTNEGPRRRVRAEVRLGAAQFLCHRRSATGRRLVVPPLPLVRGSARGSRQRDPQRRPAGHDGVRQMPHIRPGRGRLPQPVRRQPRAEAGRAPVSGARPQPQRRRAFRVHDPARTGRFLLPGVSRGLSAAGP